MKDVENEVINPALMLAISRLRENKTEEAERKMMAEALQARFLIPCLVQKSEGTEQEERRDPSNTKFAFQMIQTAEGIKFFPIFTDHMELMKWNEKQENQMIMTFPELAGLLQRTNNHVQGLVINPVTTNMILPSPLVFGVMEHEEEYRALI